MTSDSYRIAIHVLGGTPCLPVYIWPIHNMYIQVTCIVPVFSNYHMEVLRYIQTNTGISLFTPLSYIATHALNQNM